MTVVAAGRVSEVTARRMTWTGFDGSLWPLSDPFTFPAMSTGVTGLQMPPMSVFTSSTPLVPGVDIHGYSLPARSVYWPLEFESRSVEDWRTRYAGFFDSFHPTKPGVWTVGEGEDERSLELVGVFDGGVSFARDPFVTGHALIGVDLSAPRPLWRGRPVRVTFRAGEPVDFIPPGLAPTFHISDAATFGDAKIGNTGNEPAYLRWVIEGPLSNVRVGVAGAVVVVPFPVPAGQTLVIDTDPASQYAVMGVDVTAQLGFQVFAPVPAGGSSPLTISATGSGSVTAELTPLYWRAF